MITIVRGRVLGYTPQADSGTIVGDDSIRYSFTGKDWNDPIPPMPDAYVEFGIHTDLQSGLVQAVNIYRTVRPKSKIAAGVLAILLGWLGIHKFYLGHAGKGILFIVVSLLTFGFGMLVTIPVSIVEGVIYLTKSDVDFNRIYVQDKKGWF